MDKHQYFVDIHWDSDRKGIMCSPEVTALQSEKGCIEVATPPEFPKGMPGIWSPEHLFTAAVSSCFMTTFLAIAENSKLDFKSFDCKAIGVLEQLDGKFSITEVLLEPSVTIASELGRERALRVLQRTEMNCLISNSIKSKVSMNPQIKVTEPISEGL
jgi:organic hydroperoxide reductase OsmC/OhrA